jgi:hypothetical protein
VQVLEHPLAVLDLAAAEPPGVGAIQPGGMAFESHFLQFSRIAVRTSLAQHEANDHEDDHIRTV